MIEKTLRLAVLCGLAGALSLAQAQQAYPTRPITMVVPLQAGSGGDVVLRTVAQKMSEGLQQPVIVENQPGVSGLLGAARVSRAPPNGYLIGGISDSVLNYAANTHDNLTFDPINGFEPISLVAEASWVLVVNPSLGVKTLAEFVALAKTEPGKLTYASAGLGSPHHISMELLAKASQVSLRHIPYKGATQSVTDVVGGQVQATMSAVSVVLPFIKDNKLIALAVPQQARSLLLPNVPTFTEAGLPGFTFSTLVAMYAPKGTPKEIVDRLNAEVQTALADPTVKARLVPLGLEPRGSTPAQLGESTRVGYARIGKVIRDAGIKAE